MNNVVAESVSFVTTAPGVELGFLRQHDGGGMTFLVRMQKGARAPLHDHPGGEETWMIDGRLRIQNRSDAAGGRVEDVVVRTGEYCFAPPGETHDGVAEEDSLFFVVAAGGVAPA